MAEQIPFSIVENVLSSLGSSVAQKVGSMFGVGDELEKLEETLGMLNAVLLDAEEQLEMSHAVIFWVKRLKRVVYDMDDLLDDFATYRLRRQRGGPVRQVSRFFSSSNQAAFRYKMSERVKDIKESFDDIKKDFFLLNVITQNTIHRPRPSFINVGRETHSSPSQYTINLDKRNSRKEEIINLLVSPSNEHVFIVAIVGIGGLGKTTLAQQVYNHEKVKHHFELKKWVCVGDESDEGFDANALLKKMTTESKSQSLDDMKNKFHGEISQKKYLVVLDDVWNNQGEIWENVRSLLEVGAKGSKILVTSRNTEVSFMGKNTVAIKLEGLDENESWRLFSDITFGGQENTVSLEMIKVGKEIVSMCNGVPLIINTLGRTLMQFKSDLSKWVSIRKNENLLSLPYGNDNVLRVLKLSYDNLPTHLKQCFTYCALFPKDHEIDKKLLVQQWIAQGYVKSRNENEQLEDIGDQYFKELLSSSVLEEVEKDDFGNILIAYKMHDLVHDLAQSIVGSEVLVLRSDHVSNISREALHISLFEDVNPMMMNGTIIGKPIRTFQNLCEDSSQGIGIVNSFLSSFMCLRVLSLSDLNIKNVPKSLSKLNHLRYLDLSHSPFKILPDCVTRLKNLQTLKLQHCWNLEKFPRNMRELINLRHLENDGCDRLTHMPRGIGKLTLLQSLSVFVIGDEDRGGRWLRNNQKVGRLSELESLNQLRGELRIEHLENVRDVEVVSRGKYLKEKEYLQSLRLKWGESGEGDHKSVMEVLEPNGQLKELFIEGYGAREFPSWMMNDELASRLSNLIRIEIKRCRRCKILPPFSTLPSLKSLKLEDLEEVVELEKSSSAIFPSLEFLGLHGMPKLRELWNWRADSRPEQDSSFACLSEVFILGCSDLSSLHIPPSLSKLWIRGCSNLASLELPSSSSLSELRINGCRNLASLELPSSSSLSELEILDCSNLTSLELPSSSSVSKLVINGCSNLVSLELPSSSSLSELWIRDCSNLASLELSSSASLSKLGIGYCSNLASLELPSSSSLSELWIAGCSNLASLELSSSASLSRLHIDYCSNLASLELPSSSSLSELRIRVCSNLASLELSSSASLSNLGIEGCSNLASVNVASSLARLEELYMGGVKAEIFRQLMLASTSLKSLGTDGMVSHSEEWLSSLQCVSTLQTLRIENCSGLSTLLKGIGSLSSLTELAIRNCPDLTSLPEDISSLKNLRKLSLPGYELKDGEGAKIAHIPDISF